MNNAEKIKTMTDEDLAIMLMCPAEYDLNFNKTNECGGEMNRDCHKCTLDWLRAKAENAN